MILKEELIKAIEWGLLPEAGSVNVSTSLECNNFSIWLIRTLFMLQFKCQRCGSCCDSHFFTITPLFELDIKKIITNTDWAREKLEEAGTYIIVEGLKILYIPQPCMFLLDSKCSIHENRPTVCRGFPVSLVNITQPGTVGINISCPAGNKLYSDIMEEGGYDETSNHFKINYLEKPFEGVKQ